MVRRIRRSTIFSLIAVVALLSLGIGYAAWTDTLQLNGQVKTATFDVDWTEASYSVSDSVDDLGVGSCVPTISPNQNVLNVSVTNAYPGYSCVISAKIKNNSSIPVELTNYAPSAVPDGLHVDPFGCGSLGEGDDIAAGAEVDCEFGVTVLDDSQPNATYNLSATVDFVVPS